MTKEKHFMPKIKKEEAITKRPVGRPPKHEKVVGKAGKVKEEMKNDKKKGK